MHAVRRICLYTDADNPSLQTIHKPLLNPALALYPNIYTLPLKPTRQHTTHQTIYHLTFQTPL